MHFPIHKNSKYKAAVQKHNKNPTEEKVEEQNDFLGNSHVELVHPVGQNSAVYFQKILHFWDTKYPSSTHTTILGSQEILLSNQRRRCVYKPVFL